MKTKILTILFVAALVANLGFLGYRVYHSLGTESTIMSTLPEDATIVYKADANATDKSTAKNIVATDEKVQYEIVNINPNPVFASGKASGNLEITNDKHNYYPQQVEIYTKDTNQLIYSATIEVGSKIDTDTLLVNLPKGTFNCTAYFRATNPETGEGIRKESTDITITIKA